MSRVASVKTRYSTSVVERATVNCFLLHQSTSEHWGSLALSVNCSCPFRTSSEVSADNRVGEQRSPRPCMLTWLQEARIGGALFQIQFACELSINSAVPGAGCLTQPIQCTSQPSNLPL
ncbi:uncharacterized protein [Physcomitrium patens]|uniref:Uncharacterized protein n=1 Tax=Physcomitrium patens TaxID=3218 RepID=A0A2K1KBR0_PHYPA|nr:uncharacterized protein LOC112284257 [Physcomitrium patens]XP_024379690.1 uncharacterized protein LOC112284257 [Physcomitrium patens]PNR51207.1 hypothetical protein PHYPA_010393 [Physcomitrium patens]|eukprot:XP_024379689.1 uncharacterized protein LOC112284257 [Physcomitrella patens]